MAIHWQVKFWTLRTDQTLTVNVYDSSYTGDPVQLTGAAVPFETQEDTSDDVFAPVRTQSGYLRIVDTGYDNDGNAFDWREFIPTTDTDRPVTLTDSQDNVLWQGFMQAQDFGSRLFDMPQEREFPVQCVLSVMSRLYIGYDDDEGIINFAALLQYVFGRSPLSFEAYVFQGGVDAFRWLRYRFDWEVLCGEDSDGNHTGAYTLLEALENVCTYWGWSVRTYQRTVYFSCPDDADVASDLVLTPEQLSKLAEDKSFQLDIDSRGYTVEAVITNELASENNNDQQVRGVNKAVVTSDGGEFDKELIFFYPDSILKKMYAGGFQQDTTVNVAYTPRLSSFETETMGGSDNALKFFCIMRATGNAVNYKTVYKPCLHFKSYLSNDPASIWTKRSHFYKGGNITLRGRAYRYGIEFDDGSSNPRESTTHMRLKLKFTAQTGEERWWSGNEWGSTDTTCLAKLGGKSGVLYTCESTSAYQNFIHETIPTESLESFCNGTFQILFYGSDDITEGAGSKEFDLVDFALEFTLPDDPTRYIDPDRHGSNEYSATNEKVLKSEWEADTIFSTENYSAFGPGLVIHITGDYFPGWDYPNHIVGTEKPEQHLADRVASFWARSRRKITCDLRQDLLPDITPRTEFSIDGTTVWPISVSHDWRNDVATIVAIEM